ncbi:MAG: HAMP domain-containing protein [Gammaproteobacteria bacterium]|nr:HAMP domain-containing protein [Gammaproteobacteria bacterium]
MIAEPLGQVRFSSHVESMGLNLDKELIQRSSPQTHFMQDEQGAEVLRSINPVHNKPQCQECHGPVELNPVNGVLVVDYDAAPIRHKARKTTLMLMGAGALIVIINLLGGWWFIRRFILQPVESLNTSSHSLAHGQLDTRVSLEGNDELSALGETFNLMAANLQSSLRQTEEGEAFLQSMIDAIPDGVRVIDDDYNMLLVNRTFREQTGCPDKPWVGQKCFTTHNLDAPCPAELVTCPLVEIRRENKRVKVIHHHTRCDGDTLDVEIYAAPMTIIRDGKEVALLVESIRDLTHEVRFTHEQRLSELGRLAAGVAHEIYNPLSSMKLALHSLAGMIVDEGQPDEIGDYLDIVELQMDQCIRITDRLLHLSASPSGQPQLVDIQQAVEDILSLVGWDAQEASIDIVKSFPEQPLRVFANDGEIRMLVLNLVQNAFHAMPSGGKLRITGSIEADEVVVRFCDNGVGISDENLPRLFMPFFSRRADGVEGTGLGLPISRSITESFEGSLEVESELGKGSCFIVRLPEATAERLTS